MKPVFEPDHLDLFALIQDLCAPNQVVYIVGGAVRDAISGRQLHDMDFVMAEDPTHLAKRLAKRLKAGFFVLDDERHTARVVYYDREGNFSPLDFVQFTGRNLKEDLHNRDFTINAMAVSVGALKDVIDPLDGRSDLQKGLLRPCSDHALTDDPVRVLRGVRLAVQFGLDYAPGLEAALENAAALLPMTTYERQRDEFFRILAGPDPAAGLRDCWRFRVFDSLIPPVVELAAIPASPPHHLPLFDHTMQSVENYHQLVNIFQNGGTDRDGDDWRFKAALDALGKFSNQIGIFFSEEITPGRSKGALAIFSALLHDIGKPLTVKAGDDGHLHFENHATIGAEIAYQAAKQLQLSNAESDWVSRVVRYHHMHLMSFVENGSSPDRRTIYRFYKMTGIVGVAIVFHSLADILATIGSNLDRERWKKVLSVARDYLSAWWEQHEAIISPTPLLDGHDLQVMFGMEPGQQIGHLLAQLVEEQASGTIHTREQAQGFIRKQLTDS